jgi:hypothetical protein
MSSRHRRWLQSPQVRLLLVAIAIVAAGAALAAGLIGRHIIRRTPWAHIDRVWALRADEDVFAYARISPDGERLTYTSQPKRSRVIDRTVRVIDLRTGAVELSEPGIDGYWSPEGKRLIFLNRRPGATDDVTIAHLDNRAIARGVAPPTLGDYFSWGTIDGRDVIATIAANYYELAGDRSLTHQQIGACPGIGVGERPLISKDGRRVTAFVNGKVIVRNVRDCADIVRTNIAGGKADFSWDGRYIAFHVQKASRKEYEIRVVDLQARRWLVVADLPGSSLFPSWTKDGRLCFRYDSAEYRGFVIASDFMRNPWQPFPADDHPSAPKLAELVPERRRSSQEVDVLVVWAPWNAHSPDALVNLQRAVATWQVTGRHVRAVAAAEPSSDAAEAAAMRESLGIGVEQVAVARDRLLDAGIGNHIPTTLLFRDGEIYGRKLGALSSEELVQWIDERDRSEVRHF